MKKKKKKDILINCQYFYPEYITAATLAFDAARALSADGFSVDALCGYPKEYCSTGEKVPKEEFVDGVNIKRVKYLQFSRKFVFGRVINYISFFIAMLSRFFSLRHYKVIITYSTPPVLPFISALAGKFFGTKHVFVCFDVYPEIAINSGVTSDRSLMSRFMKFMNRRVYLRASKVVALSGEMKQFIVENREIPEENVEVIPNWHRDLNDASLEKTTETESDNTVFTVSYLGNMGTCQDMETIISAMEKLAGDKNIRFVFAGHGNKTETVELAARKFGNGTVYGFLQGAEYKKILSESDCFIVSLEENIVGLGVPSKTYSYMMMGKPIVSIMGDCDINRELIKYDCGIPVKNGDSEGLANALRELASDRAKCMRMGAACRRAYEENYTPEICLGKYSEMIRRILSE